MRTFKNNYNGSYNELLDRFKNRANLSHYELLDLERDLNNAGQYNKRDVVAVMVKPPSVFKEN